MRLIKLVPVCFIVLSFKAFAATTSTSNPIPPFLRDTVHIDGAGNGSGHLEVIYDSADTLGGSVAAGKAVDHLYFCWSYCSLSSGGVPTQWRYGALFYTGGTASLTGGPFVWDATNAPGWVYNFWEVLYNTTTGVYSIAAGKTAPDSEESTALADMRMIGAGAGATDLVGTDCLQIWKVHEVASVFSAAGGGPNRAKYHAIAAAITSTFTTNPLTGIPGYFQIDYSSIATGGLDPSNGYNNGVEMIGCMEFMTLWNFMNSPPHSVDPTTFVPQPLPHIDGYPDSNGAVWWQDPQIRALGAWDQGTQSNASKLQGSAGVQPIDPTPATWYPASTGTGTGTGTGTSTGTDTGAGTSTGAGTGTGTGTAGSTGTGTGTTTSTGTSSSTSTATGTATATSTSSGTATNTSTSTGIATSSSTATATSTGTSSGTSTSTGTGTGTGTNTATGSGTSTGTSTATSTGNFTATGTGTGTDTGTFPDDPLPTGAGNSEPTLGDSPWGQNGADSAFNALVAVISDFSPTSQDPATITISIPWVGPDTSKDFVISSIPATDTPMGVAAGTLRVLCRTFITLLLLWAFFKRIYKDLAHK